MLLAVFVEAMFPGTLAGWRFVHGLTRAAFELLAESLSRAFAMTTLGVRLCTLLSSLVAHCCLHRAGYNGDGKRHALTRSIAQISRLRRSRRATSAATSRES